MFAGAEVAIKVVNQPKSRSVDSDGAGSEAESDLEQEWTEMYPVEMRATPPPPGETSSCVGSAHLGQESPGRQSLKEGTSDRKAGG